MNASFRDGKQFAWDATSIELFQACPRKYYYRMIENIAPAEQSVHLLFGGIYASCLEHFYLHRAAGLSIEEALHKIVREALTSSWSSETGQPLNFDHSAKTRPNLIRSLVWYIDQFGEESENTVRTFYLQNGKPAVELSFALPLSDDLLYCGHLDRVVEYGGGLLWMDQKTTGSTVSPNWFKQFSPHNQFTGYTWAGQIVLNSPVRGGICDAAQIGVNFTRFERGFIHRTEDQINEWLDGTFYTIELAHRACEDDHFPMNLTACGNYGGCPYRAICASPKSIRPNVIKSHYKQVPPWEPSTPR